MKRKLLFIFTVICLALTFSLTAGAMEGNGTQEEPYLITNRQELLEVNNNLSACYRLENDVTASSQTGAIIEGPFTGIFDGNGKKITVAINAPADKSGDTFDALFGTVSGTVKNLTVGGTVVGSNKVAGVVGKLSGSGNVDNCKNNATVTGRKNIGGICGLVLGKATVTNCVNYGNINGKNPIKAGLDMGGIVGCVWDADQNTVAIVNCYNAGKIYGEGYNCGGIVGHYQGGGLVNCFNSGEVTATDITGYEGSIIGKTAGNYTHSIKGYFSLTSDACVGGGEGTVALSDCMLKAEGVSIYLGTGSGIRGSFCVNEEVFNVLFELIGSDGAIEYGTVISTKEVVEALDGYLLSQKAQENGTVIMAPAFKDGEKLYSDDKINIEGFHYYKFALEDVPDTKESYNREYVILGYVMITNARKAQIPAYLNTVKSLNLASSVEGTEFKSVTINRVAELTIADGDFKDNKKALNMLYHIVSFKEYENKIEIDGVNDYGHANATFTSHISSDGTVVFKVNTTSLLEFNFYVRSLISDGYEKIFESEKNGNLFYTLKKGDDLINASFFVGNNEVTISKETVSGTISNTEKQNYTEKNTSSITQIKLADNVDIKEGMSYVVHLADGTFFLIDGGWCYDNYLEADKLYQTLVSLAGEGNDIVIKGWIFTHCHGDHIGTFNYFVEKYHNSVTIEQLLYNFPSDEEISTSGSSYMLNDTKQRYNYFKKMISTYLQDTEIVKVHSGYTLYYANAKVEILQTFEDLYPKSVAHNGYDFNSSSTIFTLEIDGQKMMFTGDVSDVGAERLNSVYKNSLKCDFLQIAHHGLNYTSTIRTLYQYVDAEYILYPAPLDWYRSNASTDANNYIATQSPTVKQIFVSGIDTFKLNLPYDGKQYNGDKLHIPGVKTEADRPENYVSVPNAYFDLDLSGSAPKDAQGNASVTVTGGAITETTVMHNGESKTATAFTKGDGGDYYMTLNFNDISTDSEMGKFVMTSSTFEIFLKLDKLPGATVGLITSCNGGGVTLYLRKQAGGQINFQIGSTAPNSNGSGYKYSAAADINGTAPVAESGRLLHIVGVYDSKTNMMKVYINGILAASANYGNGQFSGGSGNDYVLGIGYNPQYNGECLSSYADYELYEARIYDTALTDEQVAQQYWNCIDNLLIEEK